VTKVKAYSFNRAGAAASHVGHLGVFKKLINDYIANQFVLGDCKVRRYVRYLIISDLVLVRLISREDREIKRF
jgi:hypothetical protein